MRSFVSVLLVFVVLLAPSLASAKTKGTGHSRGGKTDPHSMMRGNGEEKKRTWVKESVDKNGHVRKAHWRNE